MFSTTETLKSPVLLLKNIFIKKHRQILPWGYPEAVTRNNGSKAFIVSLKKKLKKGPVCPRGPQSPYGCPPTLQGDSAWHSNRKKTWLESFQEVGGQQWEMGMVSWHLKGLIVRPGGCCLYILRPVPMVDLPIIHIMVTKRDRVSVG